MTEDKSIQLDLGLAALMAEPQREPAEVSPPTDALELEAVVSEFREHEVVKSRYEVLAEQKDWEGLCKYSESALEEPGVAGCEAKLWWLRAQYELKAMPLSILVAPFESLLERLEDYLREDSAAAAVESLFPQVAELLKIFQLGGLDTSLGELLTARLAKDYSLTLEKKPDSAAVPWRDAPLQPASSAKPADVKYSSAKEVSKQRVVFMRWASGLVLGLLGCFCMYWYTQGAFSSSSRSIRSPDLILASAAPLLAGPVSDRIGRVSQLDAVLYDAENSEARGSSTDRTEKSSGNIATPVEEPPTSPQGVPVPPGEGSKKVVKAQQAEVVDTSGPVEPDGLFEDRSARPGNSSSKYGSGRDPIDSPTMTVRGAQLFRVLVRTEVLAKPTFTADRIGFLQVGDEIEVERSNGPWLQVRSRMGRVGFVMSQDVVPLR